MKTVRAIVLCAAIGIATGVAPAFADPSSNLDESVENFAAALGAGDPVLSATYYAEDAILLPPGAARIDGRAGIESFWIGVFESGVTDLALVPREVEGDGQVAHETGDFTLGSPSESGMVTVAGKYVVVWRLDDDGKWRVVRDIWNVTPQ